MVRFLGAGLLVFFSATLWAAQSPEAQVKGYVQTKPQGESQQSISSGQPAQAVPLVQNYELKGPLLLSSYKRSQFDAIKQIYQDAIDKDNSESSRLNQQVQDFSNDLSDSKTLFASVKQSLNGALANLKKLEDEEAKTSVYAYNFSKSMKSAQQNVDLARSLYRSLEYHIASVSTQIDSKKDRIRFLQNEATFYQSRIDQINSFVDNSKVSSDVAPIEQQTQDLSKRLDDFKNQLTKLKATVNPLSSLSPEATAQSSNSGVPSSAVTGQPAADASPGAIAPGN